MSVGSSSNLRAKLRNSTQHKTNRDTNWHWNWSYSRFKMYTTNQYICECPTISVPWLCLVFSLQSDVCLTFGCVNNQAKLVAICLLLACLYLHDYITTTARSWHCFLGLLLLLPFLLCLLLVSRASEVLARIISFSANVWLKWANNKTNPMLPGLFALWENKGITIGQIIRYRR